MRYLTKKDIKFPKHKKDSHKGENGYVLVIGGSKDYIGAPYLAAGSVAALRSGCDLVAVAAPEKVAWAINCLSADLVTFKLKGEYLNPKNYNELVKLIDKFDVVLIGNGIGLKSGTKKMVKSVIKYATKTNKPIVIDADALKIIKLKDVNDAVLTPHLKELEILLKNSKIKSDYSDYKSIQKYLGNNILLIKSRIDV